MELYKINKAAQAGNSALEFVAVVTLIMVAIGSAGLIKDAKRSQQAAPPPAQTQPTDPKAAPAPAPETPDHVSAPPKLKEEDRAKIFELQKKAMADQVRIDQIMQQATAQMQRLQQEMQNYSKQIDSAMEAAIKNAGVDKTSWQLNVDTLEFTPSKPNPPTAPPKPPKQ